MMGQCRAVPLTLSHTDIGQNPETIEMINGQATPVVPPPQRTPNSGSPSGSCDLKSVPSTSVASEAPPHAKHVDQRHGVESDKKMTLLDPSKYPAKRGEEEVKVIHRTKELIGKRDPTLLKRYRNDAHKISRVVMREVRPKNGYNAEKAARFYQETVEWRERFWMEHTLRHPPGKLEVVNMLVPELNYGCFDREGYPVYFLHFGLAAGKQVLNRTSSQEWANCHAYGLDMMELMCRQQTVKLGRWIDKMRVVVDFEGVSIFAIRDFMSHAKRCAHMDTTYYTGLMLSTYLINVPQSLSWATALFWPFLSAGVKRKVKLFTTGFETDLLKVIPPESLPVKYGGAREWDPIHVNSINWKAYDSQIKKTGRRDFELKRIFLKSSQKHQVTLHCAAGTQVGRPVHP
mmetsp:Transcript_14395/g.28350  ORF Transcript_14395/g.28350 Transcript_14395/m.28350 type:complete len:402 (-) Transcript_14395:757-1962(-)